MPQPSSDNIVIKREYCVWDQSASLATQRTNILVLVQLGGCSR